jgi:hypothetical protein
MIISDGGANEVSIDYADEKTIINLETTTRTASGGDLKTIPTGERFRLNVKVRVDNSTLRELIDILLGDSETIYYTPEQDYSIIYPTITFPLRVSVTGVKLDDYSGDKKYISFSVVGVSYL